MLFQHSEKKEKLLNPFNKKTERTETLKTRQPQLVRYISHTVQVNEHTVTFA